MKQSADFFAYLEYNEWHYKSDSLLFIIISILVTDLFSRATHGLMKKNVKPQQLATDDYIHDNKAAVVRDLQRKMNFKEDVHRHSSQQVKILIVIKVHFIHSSQARQMLSLMGHRCL